MRSAVVHYMDLAIDGDTILVLRRGKSVAKISGVNVLVAGGRTCCRCIPTVAPVRASYAVLRSQTARMLDRVAAGVAVDVVQRGSAVAHICRYPG